jgi:hypothetical protein
MLYVPPCPVKLCKITHKFSSTNESAGMADREKKLCGNAGGILFCPGQGEAILPG